MNPNEDTVCVSTPLQEFEIIDGKDKLKNGKVLKEREKWSSTFNYILSYIGFTVGLGNVWRFPYICSRNGGGAFVIPFIILLIVFGFPMFYLESSLSQFSGKSAVHVWSFCPLFKGVGIAATIAPLVVIPFYSLLLCWPIYYMVKSCSAVLPWTTCDNSWNTDLCVESGASVMRNLSAESVWNVTNSTVLSVASQWKNKTFAHSAAEEYWQYNVLNISDGIETIGSIQWHTVGCLFATYVVIFLAIIKGIKSVEKVVYVTVILPYILLIVIFIRTVIQPGAGKGLLMYFTPDFNKLLGAQVWLEAYIQICYSLGLGWGTIGTPSSHKSFHDNNLRDCMFLVFVAEGTSIFAGMITFTVLGVMSENLGIPISEVVSSGPGLGFITYPTALSQLPLPQLWSFLFYLMLFTIGLDSQFVQIGAIITPIVDQYPHLFRSRQPLLTGVFCIFFFLVGLICCTQGGMYVFQLVDWYISSVGVFAVTALECIAAVWIYGLRQMSRDIEMMLGKPLQIPIRFLWAFVIPTLCTVVLVLQMVWYESPTYGKYVFPTYAVIIGWFIALIPLLPMLVGALLVIRKKMNKSNSFLQSISLSLRPDNNWGPSDTSYREEHKRSLLERDQTLMEKLQAVFKR